ncbi:Kazal-type serine protease inhibitor family protein [Thermoactinospora rubra]|uniref:Kazal-type serine protease inhibitor family protein n=1 Tax=Thermoactinospora rubra TaxID=1088767 RepID=UPI000A10748C|nr:Kazal-type serine protease inhibitor [Thermoactinospora rubra]
MFRVLIGFVAGGIALAGLAAPAQGSEPRSGCVCSMEYRPVVGEDGKTYPNACSAACAGVAARPCPAQ